MHFITGLAIIEVIPSFLSFGHIIRKSSLVSSQLGCKVPDGTSNSGEPSLLTMLHSNSGEDVTHISCCNSLWRHVVVLLV
jgi:hypothetical protein